jgi:CBS domain-containing protein
MPQSFFPKSGQRLRIYIGERDQWRGKALHTVLLNVLKEQDIAGATVFRGMAGYGAHSRIRSTTLEVLSMDLPIVIEAIDAPEKISLVLNMIDPMVREGLITLEDIQLIKYTHRFLNPLPAERFVSECMTRAVITLSPDMRVGTAWKIMLQHVLKAVPVIDTDGRVIGIVTNEDLLVRAGIQERLSLAIRMPNTSIEQELAELENSTLTIEQVMSQPTITLLENETLGNAVRTMLQSGLKRLPVVNKENKLVGILSRLDILRQVVDAAPTETIAHFPVGSVKTVADIMNADIPMIHQEASLPLIIEKMIQSGSHRLIVIDEEGKVSGLISDSDLITRVQPLKHATILDAFRHKSSPPNGEENAAQLMSPGPLSAPPECPIHDAIKLMLHHARKWLVIVDENQKPLGLVDRQSLLLSLSPEHSSYQAPNSL